jgi:hypothetical protein
VGFGNCSRRRPIERHNSWQAVLRNPPGVFCIVGVLSDAQPLATAVDSAIDGFHGLSSILMSMPPNT